MTGFATIEAAAAGGCLEGGGARWRPERRREFAAGRNLARALLSKLGCPPEPIAIGERGAPIWPAGFIGSIAHSDGQVCVVVGREARFGSVGVDIEPIGAVADSLACQLFTPEESQAIAEGAVDATTLFCCKEAVYKAVYPRRREFLEFTDVQIVVAGDAFQAVVLDDTLRSAQSMRGRSGLIRTIDRRRLTCFTTAPADDSASTAEGGDREPPSATIADAV